MSRPIGLAAQAVPVADPARTVDLAAAAGFDRVGVTIDPMTWTAATTQNVRHALASSGVTLQDAEVVRLRDGGEVDDARLVDLAADVGAPYLIVISLIDEAARTVDRLAALAARGEAGGVVPILEFGRFTRVATIHDARRIAGAAGVPILVDPLHLARSGGSAADVAALPAGLLPYVQVCDAGPPPDSLDPETLLAEARAARLDIATGTLGLDAFLAALPAGLPLMNEVRSAALAAAIPDPLARARHLAGTMRAWLARRETP